MLSELEAQTSAVLGDLGEGGEQMGQVCVDSCFCAYLFTCPVPVVVISISRCLG